MRRRQRTRGWLPLASLGLLVAVGAAAGPDRSAVPGGASSDGPAGFRVEVDVRGEGRLARLDVHVVGRDVRIDLRTPDGKAPRHVLVYRGDEGRFLSIDPLDRAYVAIDRELIAAASTPTAAARREVDAQLGQLPPSLHHALERLLGVREDGRPLAEVPLLVEETAGSDRVGPFTCRAHRILRGDRPVAELCITEWDAVGIERRDLEVFRQLANFQRELMGARELTPLELVPDQPLDLLVQFDGLPLYLRGVGDVVRGEIRVTAVSPLAPGDETRALFTPPPGYAMRSAYSVLFGGGARPAAPAGD